MLKLLVLTIIAVLACNGASWAAAVKCPPLAGMFPLQGYRTVNCIPTVGDTPPGLCQNCPGALTYTSEGTFYGAGGNLPGVQLRCVVPAPSYGVFSVPRHLVKGKCVPGRAGFFPFGLTRRPVAATPVDTAGPPHAVAPPRIAAPPRIVVPQYAAAPRPAPVRHALSVHAGSSVIH